VLCSFADFRQDRAYLAVPSGPMVPRAKNRGEHCQLRPVGARHSLS
jgi:hypothetical protein